MTGEVVNLRVGIAKPEYLENFVDRALLQTLIDSKEQGGDEPLQILGEAPFKGGRLEKTADRMLLDESRVMPLIWGKRQSAH